MHRFYVPTLQLAAAAIELPAAQARQIARVLRLRAGQRIELFDGRGTIGEAELSEVDAHKVTAAIRLTRYVEWPQPWRPLLYLSLIRPQRFEWAIEKATELGAWAVVPVTCARTTHGGETIGAARLTRWQQIAAEAAEQCGAAFVPEVRPCRTLAQALAEPADARLFAWKGHAEPLAQTLTAALAGAIGREHTVSPTAAIYIGPEGGFEEAELQAAIAADCRPVTLGPRTLRAETAALAALAALLASTGPSSDIGATPTPS